MCAGKYRGLTLGVIDAGLRALMVSNTFVTSLGPDIDTLLSTLPVRWNLAIQGRALGDESASTALLLQTLAPNNVFIVKWDVRS